MKNKRYKNVVKFVLSLIRYTQSVLEIKKFVKRV